MKRPNRKILWDRGGVSEVIGTILTLSITVVLFSSIILMVDQFPAPGDNVYTNFTATIEPRNDWVNGAYIHITNTGGQPMSGNWTIIVLTVDSFTYTLDTQGIIDTFPYGLGPDVPGHRGSDNGDDNWNTGERWTLYRNATTINQDSDIGVMILDSERNALVWSSSIQGVNNEFGPIITNIRADSDLRSLRSDPIEFGRPFVIYADIYDPDGDLNISSVYLDFSSIGPNYNRVNMSDPDGDGTFISEEIMGPNTTIPIGYHVAIIHADDLAGMHSSGVGRVVVGRDIGSQPNLVIRADEISLSSPNPINGQTVLISVTVKNYGGWCDGVLNFYDIMGTQSVQIGSENFTISDSPDQITKIFYWPANIGGVHTIMVEGLPINATDADYSDNRNSTDISVMPTILLVDDDNHVSDLSGMDTVSYMRAALESSNFEYELYTVGTGRNGPGYEYGETRLMDYDIIIWMTGYEDADTLTQKDQQNITAYLNDDIGAGRTGSLWLIGQYLFEDHDVIGDGGIGSDGADVGTFILNNLKVTSFINSSSGPTNPLMGVTGNPVSRDWNVTFIPMIERVAGESTSYLVKPNLGEGAEITFINNATGTQGDAINYENIALDSRVLFCPWEFSRIEMNADQTQVAYKALMWLGNITKIFGQDLAISQQDVNPPFVFYNQEVKIDAVIRNNGADNQTTQARLYFDGKPMKDNGTFIPNIFVEGMGGTATISANWTADKLGVHVFRWVVDPEGKIAETNEGNNQVPSYVSSGEVFVEFRILIVDDDGSSNNNGTLHNDTEYLTDSLTRLDYTYESDNGVNTTYVVITGEDGPSIDILKDYSAVFWITGAATAGLTVMDSLNLESYLKNEGRLWLIGNDLWSGISSNNLTSKMGIDTTLANLGVSGNLRGVDDSRISHGMNISIQNNPTADVLVPKPGAEGVFYRDYQAGTYAAVAYDGGDYQGLTCGFNLSTLYGTNMNYLNGNESLDELTYMFLHWLDKPDTRDEARITEQDYYVSDLHPQIGGAYILRARVHNIGANDVNLLVRFMDGTTQVGADSISITPDNCTSAEIIWRPLFAGQRTISILIDPINEESEIFDWFNNNISFNIYVYFFWDDMENGDAKWSHGSTIMNINGENPLDYTSPEIALSTDILTEWDWAETYGIDNTTQQAHSYPNSFYMEEGTGLFGKANVLISFAIDDSRSMQDRLDNGVSWLERAKDAAKALLDGLSDDSVCVSIWDFNGNMERRWFGPDIAPMTSTRYRTNYVEPEVRLGDDYGGMDGREYIRNIIDTMKNAPGQTILWDSIGGAYEDVKFYRALYPDLLPVVIVLSDGADVQASDNAGIAANRIEGGSAYWCPWDSMYIGNNASNPYNYRNDYTMHRGKYTFDWANPTTTTKWLRAMDHGGSMDNDRIGLLTADLKIFTIGLGLEHHDMPPTAGTTLTGWPGEVDDNNNALCTDSSISPPCEESGTLEYNLWRIANTSGAEYFYAPDASDLDDIFSQLGRFLASGFNQTRSAAPVPVTRAVHDNSDKRAVTPSFSLENVSTAKLSFWHKYNILQGGNGAFLQVGYKTSAAGDWLYKYLIPTGQYTGGLHFSENRYDDFGNLIKWCWNGLSGSGSFGWDYVGVDISPYIPEGANPGDGHVYRSEVVVNFNYTQFGGGTGVGWYIDDARLVVSRANSATIDSTTKDIWTMNNTIAHSGSYSWCNIDPVTGEMKPGIDNYLITTPIDLSSAKNAYLSAYFRFNTNYNGGAPPDGFRVEVSSDGGITWASINLGVRSAWGISGTGFDAEDGNASDGKTYTGIGDSGEGAYLADDYWVEAGTMSRLNLDLGSWNGNQILIRFRVVTNNLNSIFYAHDDNANFGSDPGFGGFFIDDVQVYGETIFG